MKYLTKIFKTQQKNVKSSEEAVEVINEIEKIIKSKYFGFPTNKAKYLKDLS